MLLNFFKKINKRVAEKLSLSLVLLLVTFIGCLIGLYAITDMIFEDRDLSFDENVFSFLKPHISNTRISFFNTVTFFGSFAFLFPANILMIAYFIIVKKERHDAWKVAAISITSMLVLFFLKGFLHRQRPLLPIIAKLHDYSFPSGHTFSSVVFFGMMIYIIYHHDLKSKIKWLLIIVCSFLIVLIGFSRVYLRFHYASDVLAGFCLGIVWLVLARWVLIKTEKMDA